MADNIPYSPPDNSIKPQTILLYGGLAIAGIYFMYKAFTFGNLVQKKVTRTLKK